MLYESLCILHSDSIIPGSTDFELRVFHQPCHKTPRASSPRVQTPTPASRITLRSEPRGRYGHTHCNAPPSTAMAFLKTLNPLIRRQATPISNPRPLLSLHTVLDSSSPNTTAAATPFANAVHTHVPIRSSGPLFLSSAPWMLSQSATPLTAAAAALGVKLRRAQALPGGRALAVAAAVGWEHMRISRGEAEVATSSGIVGYGGERFLNAPNLVSIGRMVSGPVIGW